MVAKSIEEAWANFVPHSIFLARLLYYFCYFRIVLLVDLAPQLAKKRSRIYKCNVRGQPYVWENMMGDLVVQRTSQEGGDEAPMAIILCRLHL